VIGFVTIGNPLNILLKIRKIIMANL